MEIIDAAEDMAGRISEKVMRVEDVYPVFHTSGFWYWPLHSANAGKHFKICKKRKLGADRDQNIYWYVFTVAGNYVTKDDTTHAVTDDY